MIIEFEDAWNRQRHTLEISEPDYSELEEEIKRKELEAARLLLETLRLAQRKGQNLHCGRPVNVNGKGRYTIGPDGKAKHREGALISLWCNDYTHGIWAVIGAIFKGPIRFSRQLYVVNSKYIDYNWLEIYVRYGHDETCRILGLPGYNRVIRE